MVGEIFKSNASAIDERTASFVPRRRNGLDERLIIATKISRSDRTGLPMRFGCEPLIAYVRHPDLEQPVPPLPHTAPVSGKSVSDSHAPMLHVTTAECLNHRQSSRDG
jgi:hypothetical protein